MTAPLTDHVQVDITAEVAKIARAGFNLALLVSQTAAWADPETVREYSSAAEVLADFSTSAAEYKAAAKFFASTPRPPKLLIGKVAAARRAIQRFAITPTAVNSYTYRMKVNGTAVTFASDASATVAEIIAGLKAAIDALALAVTTSDQTTYLRVLANTAGAFFALETDDPNLSIVQDHADPGIATDLAAIAVERNDWYGLLTTHNSKAVVDAAAAWAETNRKFYCWQTQDTTVRDTVASGTDDVGESTKASSIDHSLPIWSKGTDDFADAAWVGKNFPTNPGEETWKFKTLPLVTVGVYTSTHRSHFRAKNVNFYEETAGVNITQEGICSSGKYADFVRYLDYLIAKIGERVYRPLVTSKKVPYSDKGIATIQAAISAQLLEDEGREVLEPGWVVNVPKRADVDVADRTDRILPNITFEAVYSGAVHKVVITGALSV